MEKSSMIDTTTRVAIRCLMLALAAAPGLGRAETVPLTQLQQTTHFHGIAVDPRSPGHIYLATHHGFFSVAPDGQATRLSSDRNDYMGFTPHPQKAGVLFATGHPERGGNMGFIRSDDGGTTWRQLSKGAGGPVDFHQMDVSRADPNHVYGVYRGCSSARTEGKAGASWQRHPRDCWASPHRRTRPADCLPPRVAGCYGATTAAGVGVQTTCSGNRPRWSMPDPGARSTLS
jgi:hypothetical protein